MSQAHKHAEFICAKANGSDIQERIPGTLNYVDMGKDDWEFLNNCEYRIKPEPKYPETRISDQEMQDFVDKLPTVSYIAARRSVANFVLRRAIQDGDVVLPEGKA